jgi:uncharacterized protein YndB with AHSA1/START domain
MGRRVAARYAGCMKTPRIARRRMATLLLASLLALSIAPTARADTSVVSASGFLSTFREELSVTPEVAWKAIVQLPRWWSPKHSYSGVAGNMSLDLQAGGCWCERWGEGHSVQHGQVLMVQNGRVLRLSAALGPLQDMAVNGVFTVVTSAQEGKTFLRMTYRVAGAPEANLDKVAPVVDKVIGEQFARLKMLAETGQLPAAN